jgi:hypothetical protein
MAKKYIIHKGYQGWGDRLQSLSYCLEYAKKTGRYIFIDWNDPLWSQGDLRCNFYRYFSLEGVNEISCIDEIPKSSTVYPAYWYGKLEEPGGIWIHNKRSALEIRLDLERPEDVVVHTAIGFRKWSASTIADSLRLKPTLLDVVKYKLSLIKDDKYYAVHLRGTDRCTTLSICKDIVEQISKLPVLPIVLISDDQQFVKEWFLHAPDTILATQTTYKLNGLGLGTHMLPPEKLSKYNLTKNELNLDLLSDFFVYALGTIHFSNNKSSTFSQMAKLLGTVDETRSKIEKFFR